ncbi:MAG: (Fe-S)-binding protein [Promethearchaeota archaeon]|nr:MAG: (Fe-S)-binding protein [Candidatus Lokiarchaeota archaeon]
MNENILLEQISSCIDCKNCNEVCDTFLVTQNPLQSPNGRLKIAEKVFHNKEIAEEEKFGLYTCTLCALCDLRCEQSIEISKIIHASKIKLVEQNKAPYEIHNKIIAGIVDNDNSVGGNPEERLDWLPDAYRKSEVYENKDSDTLLFLGCMSSFRVKESASASYEILKQAGFDFKIFEHEPCCGEYTYSAGKLDLAKKTFHDNFERFKKNGIKNIIVTCGGCFYAFNNVYPEYVEGWDIKVNHIIQVVHELEKNGKIKLNKLKREVTYHDACRMGRKIKDMDIYDEPREILEKCGFSINELEANRVNSLCCGAGSGVRGVDSELCISMGSNLVNTAKDDEIISSCPLCVFNFRYVDYKKKLGKNFRYITDCILEALEK